MVNCFTIVRQAMADTTKTCAQPKLPLDHKPPMKADTRFELNLSKFGATRTFTVLSNSSFRVTYLLRRNDQLAALFSLIIFLLELKRFSLKKLFYDLHQFLPTQLNKRNIPTHSSSGYYLFQQPIPCLTLYQDFGFRPYLFC